MGGRMSITMHIGLLIAEPAAERYGVPLWFLIAGIVMIIIMVLSPFEILSGQ